MRWLIVILVSFLLACTKKEAAPEPPAAAEGAQAESTADAPPEVPRPKGAEELPAPLRTAAPPVDAPAVIEVLDPGAEPRTALGWALKATTPQKVRLSVGFAIDALVVVLRVGEPTYIVNFDLTMTPGKARADGTLPVSFTVDTAKKNVEVIAESRKVRLESALETANQLEGSYLLGPRGRITSLKLDVPDGANRTANDIADNLRWAIQHMTPELPEQPLGKGAKWTIHHGIRQGGIHTNELITWELVEVEGSTAQLSMTAQQSGAIQTFQTPGLPVDQELKLLSADANGTLTWDATKLAPSKADLTSTVLKAIDQTVDDPDEGSKTVEVLVQTNRALTIGIE